MGQGVDELAILVEAGRESDRAGEIDAGKPCSQPRVIDRKSGERRYSPPRQAEAQRELPDGVALIGRQPEQEWPEDAAIERHPRGSPGHGAALTPDPQPPRPSAAGWPGARPVPPGKRARRLEPSARPARQTAAGCRYCRWPP